MYLKNVVYRLRSLYWNNLPFEDWDVTLKNFTKQSCEEVTKESGQWLLQSKLKILPMWADKYINGVDAFLVSHNFKSPSCDVAIMEERILFHFTWEADTIILNVRAGLGLKNKSFEIYNIENYNYFVDMLSFSKKILHDKVSFWPRKSFCEI